jgi:SAM-dependent methyltransferase
MLLKITPLRFYNFWSNLPKEDRKLLSYFPYWNYAMRPIHLSYLCSCIEATKDIDGSVVEIGCWRGETTLFLNFFMDDIEIEKDYFAIDTFEGFTSEDISVEIKERGQGNFKELYERVFTLNKETWFNRSMSDNDIKRVKAIKADANYFDFSQIGSISFCLLDVDLYQPIKRSLARLYELLTPGGIIVVDDYLSLWNWCTPYSGFRESQVQ